MHRRRAIATKPYTKYKPAKVSESTIHKRGTPVKPLPEIAELKEFKPKKYTAKEIKKASKKRTAGDLRKILEVVEKIPRENRLRQLLNLGIDERTIIHTLLTNNYKYEYTPGETISGYKFSFSGWESGWNPRLYNSADLGKYLYQLGFNNPERINKIVTDFAKKKKLNFNAQDVINGFQEAAKNKNVDNFTFSVEAKKNPNLNNFALKLKNNKYSFDRILYEIKKAGYNNPTAIGKILSTTGHQSKIRTALAKFGYKAPKQIGEAYNYDLKKMYNDGFKDPVFLGKAINKFNVFKLVGREINELSTFVKSLSDDYNKHVFYGKLLYGMGANTPEKLGYVINDTQKREGRNNRFFRSHHQYGEILNALNMDSAKDYGAFLKGVARRERIEDRKYGVHVIPEYYNLRDLNRLECSLSKSKRISNDPRKLADFLIGGGFGVSDFYKAFLRQKTIYGSEKTYNREFLGKMYASVNADPSKLFKYIGGTGIFSAEDISKLKSQLKRKK